MTNNKQSSLVWYSVKRDVLEIEVRLGKISSNEYAEELAKAEQQAKAMHKEEIEKVAEDWWNEGAGYMFDGQREYNSFEQYYNETFDATMSNNKPNTAPMVILGTSSTHTAQGIYVEHIKNKNIHQ